MLRNGLERVPDIGEVWVQKSWEADAVENWLQPS